MNDKANKAEALKLCNEYVEKGTKMMNDAILCISALENKDDIQECIAKVVSCFNVSIEFVVAAVNSHRNGGHACGECKRFGNKAVLKCVYRGANHPACDDFEQREPNISAEILLDAETVPVVTEKAEAVHDYRKCENWCRDCNILSCDECTNFVPKRDAVNHPEHYTQGGIECIDALKAATTGLKGIEAVCTANAIKYLFRWKHKNGIEDIRKCIWYCERLIKELSDEE